jgi:glycosyltransferase involved in cell wall biosynthesis
MQRICHSLQSNDYNVVLIGTDLRSNKKPTTASYQQKQINCLFKKGKLFYAEFNLRAFFLLLLLKFNAVCAVDLDSVLPCLLVSKLRNKKRIYDAHELFCELPEVIARPAIYRAWKKIERFSLPHFPHGYTVSESISKEYKKMYGHEYETFRNMPLLTENGPVPSPIQQPYILYQGALNKGRGLESLIPAMQHVSLPLVICGEGNFSVEAMQLVQEYRVENKVFFHGMIEPAALPAYTFNAVAGINLGDGTGLNNYYSLNNKFFDYIHASLPQVAMDFPEFRKINDEFEVAVLVPTLDIEAVATAINSLIENKTLHSQLKVNCNRAKFVLNWQEEEKKLLRFYDKVI